MFDVAAMSHSYRQSELRTIAHTRIHTQTFIGTYVAVVHSYPVIDNEFSSSLTRLHKIRTNCMHFNQIGIWHLTCECFFSCLSLPWDTSLLPFVSRLSSSGIGHVSLLHVEHQPSHTALVANPQNPFIDSIVFRINLNTIADDGLMLVSYRAFRRLTTQLFNISAITSRSKMIYGIDGYGFVCTVACVQCTT